MPKHASFEALTAAVSEIFGPLFAEGASQTIFSVTLEKRAFLTECSRV